LIFKFCANQGEESSSGEPLLSVFPQLPEAFQEDILCFLAVRQGWRILSIFENSYLIGEVV
jgi:hypothetical protein